MNVTDVTNVLISRPSSEAMSDRYASLPCLDQNSNSRCLNRNISKDAFEKHLAETSYAMTSNYIKLTSTSIGSWGSSAFVPTRQNRLRRLNCQPMSEPQGPAITETNHYATAWNQEQNRDIYDPYSSLPQLSPYLTLPARPSTLVQSRPPAKHWQRPDSRASVKNAGIAGISQTFKSMAGSVVPPSISQDRLQMSVTAGPESLPYIPTSTYSCQQEPDRLIRSGKIAGGQQLKFQSYSLGKSSTLPRPPKAKFNERMTNLEILEDREPTQVKDLSGSNLIRKSPWLQTNPSCTQVNSKNRTEPGQPRESSKYAASPAFHSQTLPRPPKRLPGEDRGPRWRERNQNIDVQCSERNNNRVKFLVQSFENHVLKKIERPRNDGITLNSSSFVSPPKEFEDKNEYEALENKESFGNLPVCKLDEELFSSQAAFQISNELPKARKKIPPKVAPKPNRKYEIDFSEPKSLHGDVNFSIPNPGLMYSSADCLTTLSDTESFDRKQPYGDSPDIPDNNGESLMSFSGVNSDSGMYSLRESSSLNPKFCILSRSSGSGINSQSSTVSSCASTGIFENDKACESIPFDGDNDKEKKHMEVHDKTCNMRVFQEEEDCEEMIAELTSYFSPASTVPHQATGKSRDNILRDVLGLHNSYLNSQFDSKEDDYQRTDCNSNFRDKSEVQNFDRMKMELQCKIVAKLKSMRSKESWIHAEKQENSQGFKIIEEKLKIIARTYEVDKFKLHIMEIEKIMSLILGLSYRLIPVEHALYNMEWNGVDERYDLERKRDKLVGQLEEAKVLWCSIDKRTGVVAGYIEQYLPYQDVINFRQLVKTKLTQMVEMKELQEKIREGERQLRSVKLLID